jgi:hypothetical protein
VPNAKRVVATVLVVSLAVLLLYGLQRDSDEQAFADESTEPTPDKGRPVDPVVHGPSRSFAPSAAGAQLGHLVGTHVGAERQGIRIAELDALLEANDGEFRAREQDVHTELSHVLKGDPAAEAMEVRCADGFCRLKLDKPVDQGMAWHEIDQAIAPVTKGEMIFGAEPNGDKRTTAYVYFSLDSQLPMAAAARGPEDE